jgi:hypothetical protein
MKGKESGDVRKSEDAEASVGAQMPRAGSIPAAFHHSARPTDMIKRQLAANRFAIRYRNPETGKRHFCHLPYFPYKAAFLRDTLGLRAELKKRKA